MDFAYRSSLTDRRLGLLLTFLVHAVLVIGWQMVRTLPKLDAQADGPSSRITWIPLPRLAPERRKEEAAQPPTEAPLPLQLPLPRPHAGPALPPPPPMTIVNPAPAPARSTDSAASLPAAPATGAEAPSQPAASSPSAEQILQQAKRDIRGIDKSLRKENRPYIAAPLDSPEIRMRRKMEEAAALAPRRLWEAPKVEELVNNTGDGARRSRVITGGGTYCITERATNTSIDMIEKHGKQMFTTCPEHESPASKQEWRTLQDR